MTYNFVIDYYQENLKRHAVSSTIDFVYGVFFSFFNQRDIVSQFEFKDTVTDSYVGMYSWANPGFSRLSMLKKTILKIEERYIVNKKLLAKNILVELISSSGRVAYGVFEARWSKEQRRTKLQLLERHVVHIPKNYLTPTEASHFLAKLLMIAFFRESMGNTTNMGEFLVQQLNEEHYRDYKNLIDPEKRHLIYDDVMAFVMCSQEHA